LDLPRKEFGVWVRVYGFLKSVCRHHLEVRQQRLLLQPLYELMEESVAGEPGGVVIRFYNKPETPSI